MFVIYVAVTVYDIYIIYGCIIITTERPNFGLYACAVTNLPWNLPTVQPGIESVPKLQPILLKRWCPRNPCPHISVITKRESRRHEDGKAHPRNPLHLSHLHRLASSKFGTSETKKVIACSWSRHITVQVVFLLNSISSLPFKFRKVSTCLKRSSKLAALVLQATKVSRFPRLCLCTLSPPDHKIQKWRCIHDAFHTLLSFPGQGTERDSKKVTGSLKSNHMQLQTGSHDTLTRRHPQIIVYQKTQSLLISFADDLRQTAPRWSPCRDLQSRFARQLIVNEARHMLQLDSSTRKHQRTGYPPDSAGLSLSCQLGQKHLWHVWPSLPECVVLRHGQPVRREKQTNYNIEVGKY